jgi:hypothetical protein
VETKKVADPSFIIDYANETHLTGFIIYVIAAGAVCYVASTWIVGLCLAERNRGPLGAARFSLKALGLMIGFLIALVLAFIVPAYFQLHAGIIPTTICIAVVAYIWIFFRVTMRHFGMGFWRTFFFMFLFGIVDRLLLVVPLYATPESVCGKWAKFPRMDPSEQMAMLSTASKDLDQRSLAQKRAQETRQREEEIANLSKLHAELKAESARIDANDKTAVQDYMRRLEDYNQRVKRVQASQSDRKD